jgi:hypothetical protein
MIEDMASLKQAMEQMDADDVAVAHAGRDRAAQILSSERMNFAKLAELIEERRLLLRPRIVASIKRMDQPDGLGDAAFRDSGASLRMEGQSFGQIAEALELGGGTAPRYDKARRDALHPMTSEIGRDLPDASHTSSFPVRGLIQLVVLGLLAVASVYGLREFAAGNWHFPGYRAGLRSAQQRADTTPTSPAPAQSASPDAPSNPSAPTTTTPPPAAGETAPPASSSSAPANPAAASPPAASPPAATPPRYPPSTSAANEYPRTAQSRVYNDFMPDKIRRKSRFAGPCMGGVGGCYWGGGRY